MKDIKEYINEALIKKDTKIDTMYNSIDLPSEIERNGKKYYLIISKDSDITGRSNGGYLIRYISEPGNTLFGIAGKDIKGIVPKIKKLIKSYTS